MQCNVRMQQLQVQQRQRLVAHPFSFVLSKRQRTWPSCRGISISSRFPLAWNKIVGITQQILVCLLPWQKVYNPPPITTLKPPPPPKNPLHSTILCFPRGCSLAQLPREFILLSHECNSIVFYFIFALIVSVWHIGRIVSPTMIDANWCVLLMEFLPCAKTVWLSMQHKLGGKQKGNQESILSSSHSA